MSNKKQYITVQEGGERMNNNIGVLPKYKIKAIWKDSKEPFEETYYSTEEAQTGMEFLIDAFEGLEKLTLERDYCTSFEG